MKNYTSVLSLLLLLSTMSFADRIILLNGDELTGTVNSITEERITYTPQESSSEKELQSNSVFMVRYDSGERVVIAEFEDPSSELFENRFGVSMLIKSGVFGLININEDYFDAGIITVGAAPAFDYRINRILYIGSELMFLWALPNTDNEARSIINLNAFFRLSFPMTEKLSFRSQLGIGIAFWPEVSDELAADSTFYDARQGWDAQLAFGFEYKPHKRVSYIFTAGYIANFSSVDDVPVTIDMMMISFGPRITF